MSGKLQLPVRSVRGGEKDEQELHALQPSCRMEPPSFSSQVAEIKLEKSTLLEDSGRWENTPAAAVAAQLRLCAGSSRAACSPRVARERDDGEKEHGHLLGNLSLMYDLRVRIYVQVPRERNTVITIALAASTINLPVVLSEGI